MPKKLNVATVLGARPQFIKAAMISRAFSNRSIISETIIHTGQHFDENMSHVFFEELQLPKQNYNLGIGGGSHGQNTGRMIENIEIILVKEKPDIVLVYGDTDSTLAGALAAAKLHIPVAHVESGLRSFNRRMPEEINRILTDQLSTILFCPTEIAIQNLNNEGFPNKLKNNYRQIIINAGDVMYDATLYYKGIAEKKSNILKRLNLKKKKYVLSTIHREENTDDIGNLTAILDGLAEVAKIIPVVMPLHPRTKKKFDFIEPEFVLRWSSLIIFQPPLGYLDMVMLEKNAGVIATDSGGIQKEAFFHKVPCVTLRGETEWMELVKLGWNHLVKPGEMDISKSILDALQHIGQEGNPYGNGNAAEVIHQTLIEMI